MKRAEAKLLNLIKYVTGKPCKHGHLSERYTSTSVCVVCAQIQSKAWKNANPEKNLDSMRKWLVNNRQLHNVRVKKWQSVNKDKIRIAAKAWNHANPEKVKAKHLRHIKKYPEAYTARAVASVAKRNKRVPQWLNQDDKWVLQEAYKLAKLRTKMFGFTWEVDHIIPLRGKNVSGLHVPTNIQVIPKVLNRTKGNIYIS